MSLVARPSFEIRLRRCVGQEVVLAVLGADELHAGVIESVGGEYLVLRGHGSKRATRLSLIKLSAITVAEINDPEVL